MCPVSPPSPRLEIVSHAPPDRLNEDAWVAIQTGPRGEQIVLAAIDGATTRLTPPALQRHLDEQGAGLTPAAFAARVARDSLARQVGAGLPPDVRTLLLEANADLGRELIRLFGALTLASLDFPEEILSALKGEPRTVRLGLPACTMTLAIYDRAAQTLHYAHAGDSLLLVAYADGRASVPTQGESAPFDHALQRRALGLREYYPDLPFRELVKQPEVVRANLQAALRHNYVDEHGLPQPNQGIGVINGLPELRYFVHTGTVALDGAEFICALTDGLEWPSDREEAFAQSEEDAAEHRHDRHAFMAQAIRKHGLAGYLGLLREAEAEDADHERFPRMKTHDDASGVLLRLR